jgi:hypothetical protein
MNEFLGIMRQPSKVSLANIGWCKHLFKSFPSRCLYRFVCVKRTKYGQGAVGFCSGKAGLKINLKRWAVAISVSGQRGIAGVTWRVWRGLDKCLQVMN